MSTKEPKKKEFLELTPEELAQVDKESKNLIKSCYMIDFTSKNIEKPKGFGKINAFIDGNRLNPKLNLTGSDPNSLYIKKNKSILSQSKTGISTYQYDYCGIKLKEKAKTHKNIK
mgnify:CR=1 FL=1